MNGPIVFLTLPEVLMRLGCGKTWLYEQTDPLLKPVRRGRENRWPEVNIVAYQKKELAASGVELATGEV